MIKIISDSYILEKDVPGWILTSPDFPSDIATTLQKGSEVSLIERDNGIKICFKKVLLNAPDKGKKFYVFEGELK